MPLAGNATKASILSSILQEVRSQLQRGEPLDFLYPPWFATFGAGNSSLARRTTQRPPSYVPSHRSHYNGNRKCDSSPYRTSNRQYHSDTIRSIQIPEEIDIELANGEDRETGASQNDQNHQDETALAAKDPLGGKDMLTTDANTMSNRPSTRKTEEPADSEPLFSDSKATDRNYIEHEPQKPAAFRFSRVSTPSRYATWPTNLQAARMRRTLINRMIRDKGPLSSDWRLPLRLLQIGRHQRSISPGGNEQVWIPEQALQTLIGYKNEVTWYIPDTNCAIHVRPESESDGIYRKCVLKGSTLSVEKAKDKIAAAWAEIAYANSGFFEALPLLPSRLLASLETGDDFPVLRSVWSARRHRRVPRTVNEIPVPKQWTPTSFAEYVEALVSAAQPRGLNRSLTRDGGIQHELIRKRLERLFSATSNRPNLSSRALNAALRFLSQHEFHPTSRRLCLLYEQAGLGFVSETYAILLHSSARVKDLFHYTYVLSMMIRHNLAIDHEAWVALLHVIDSLEVKIKILGYMKGYGLLRFPHQVETAVATIIEPNFTDHLNVYRGNVDHFVDLMDQRYGKYWFGSQAGNLMLRVLADTGRLEYVSAVLQLFRDRDISMNTKTLNAILRLCRELGAVPVALSFFKELHQRSSVQPDGLTYTLLFEMAWRVQNANLCRAVWAHACLEGLVTQRMQDMIFQSAMTPKHESKDWIYPSSQPMDDYGHRDTWIYQAGKLILNIRKDVVKTENLTLGFETLASHTQRYLAKGAIARETNELKELETSVRESIAHDLRVSKTFQAKDDVHLSLRKAYALDLQCQALEVESLRWRLEHSYQVRMTCDSQDADDEGFIRLLSLGNNVMEPALPGTFLPLRSI